MNVLINALALRAGGGQTHLFHILSHLPTDPKNQFYLLVPLSFKEPENLPRLQRLYPIGLRWIERPILRLAWERIVLPLLLRRLRINVLFAPGGIVVGIIPRGCKIVTACQNMMPFDHVQRARYPHGYMRLRTWLLEGAFLRSFSRSDLVVFISEFGRTTIEKLLAPKKLKSAIVAPAGVNPKFLKTRELPRPAWLPKEYLLYVSTIDVYKAQLEVVRAFALLLAKSPQSPLKLLLIGSEYKPYADLVRKEVEELGLTDRVFFKGLVPYADLPAVYQHAAVNIFASECENCPNILMEAMAAGRPLVVSKLPPMPEFGGDAVTYFDPARPEDLARVLNEVLSEDAAKSRARTDAAIERVKQYDWATSSRQIWQGVLTDLRDQRGSQI